MLIVRLGYNIHIIFIWSQFNNIIMQLDQYLSNAIASLPFFQYNVLLTIDLNWVKQFSLIEPFIMVKAMLFSAIS